jgi:tRNA (Thr-GGU) A37 N-methylase
LYVSQVDILHGTPLLDIKPYVAGFDAFPTQRNGWLDAVGVAAIKQGRSDQRFQNQGTGEKE